MDRSVTFAWIWRGSRLHRFLVMAQGTTAPAEHQLTGEPQMNTTTAAAPKTTRSKKVLVPLATLLAAGAIAVGSGASFTSTTENTISAVTSGTLEQSNSKDNAAVFNLA